MIKNKVLDIKIIFIKNKLKTFQVSKQNFILQKVKKLFSKLFFRIILKNSYYIEPMIFFESHINN